MYILYIMMSSMVQSERGERCDALSSAELYIYTCIYIYILYTYIAYAYTYMLYCSRGRAEHMCLCNYILYTYTRICIYAYPS